MQIIGEIEILNILKWILFPVQSHMANNNFNLEVNMNIYLYKIIIWIDISDKNTIWIDIIETTITYTTKTI